MCLSCVCLMMSVANRVIKLFLSDAAARTAGAAEGAWGGGGDGVEVSLGTSLLVTA